MVCARDRRSRVARLLALSRSAVGRLAEAARRAAEQAPAFAVAVARLPIVGTRAGLALLQRASFTRSIACCRRPAKSPIVFRRIQPDVLLLTPLLYFRSHQVDHVRCARQLGHQVDSRRRQLGSPHDEGVDSRSPRSRARVERGAESAKRSSCTACPPIASWSPARRRTTTGSRPSRSLDRDAFCRQVGLDPARPILLYLCSSPFIAPHEVGFVRRWIAAIRGSADPRLRTRGLLVRPHPQNGSSGRTSILPREFENVALWPKTGVNPIGGAARADYFDSMYHAEGRRRRQHQRHDRVGHHRPPGVLGVGRGVRRDAGRHAALPAPEERRGRTAAPGGEPRGTRRAAGAAARRRRASGSARGRFIQAFIRPHGLESRRRRASSTRSSAFAAGRARAGIARRSLTRALRVALVPAAVVATVMTMERAKLRSMVLHWTRPARLAFRGARVAADLRRAVRPAAAAAAASRCGIAGRVGGCSCVPARWLVNRSKMRAARVPRLAQGRAGARCREQADADFLLDAAPRLVPGVRAGHP